MTEERRQILEMLAAGKINAGEADRLLGAVQGGSSTSTATATVTAAPPKYLRVMIDAKEGKIYRSKMKLVEGGKKLEVRGYIGVSLFGRSQTWMREE